MSNILAGIGRGQMEVISKRVDQRRAINEWYRSFLEGVDGLSFQSEPNANYYSNYWLTALTIDKRLTRYNREEIRFELLAENIESRPLWKPMHLQPIFMDMPYFGDGCSEALFENGLCLPSGSNLSQKQKTRIKKVLTKLFA